MPAPDRTIMDPLIQKEREARLGIAQEENIGASTRTVNGHVMGIARNRGAMEGASSIDLAYLHSHLDAGFPLGTSLPLPDERRPVLVRHKGDTKIRHIPPDERRTRTDAHKEARCKHEPSACLARHARTRGRQQTTLRRLAAASRDVADLGGRV